MFTSNSTSKWRPRLKIPWIAWTVETFLERFRKGILFHKFLHVREKEPTSASGRNLLISLTRSFGKAGNPETKCEGEEELAAGAGLEDDDDELSEENGSGVFLKEKVAFTGGVIPIRFRRLEKFAFSNTFL